MDPSVAALCFPESPRSVGLSTSSSSATPEQRKRHVHLAVTSGHFDPPVLRGELARDGLELFAEVRGSSWRKIAPDRARRAPGVALGNLRDEACAGRHGNRIAYRSCLPNLVRVASGRALTIRIDLLVGWVESVVHGDQIFGSVTLLDSAVRASDGYLIQPVQSVAVAERGAVPPWVSVAVMNSMIAARSAADGSPQSGAYPYTSDSGVEAVRPSSISTESVVMSPGCSTPHASATFTRSRRRVLM
jgi:hypothetical protein